jgi:hypothetical protein
VAIWHNCKREEKMRKGVVLLNSKIKGSIKYLIEFIMLYHFLLSHYSTTPLLQGADEMPPGSPLGEIKATSWGIAFFTKILDKIRERCK